MNRLNDPQALQDGEHDRCCHDRTHLATGIGSHGMHEKEILGVVFMALPLNDTGGHGVGRDTSGSNEGVDLSPGEDLHQFSKDDTTGRIETNGQETQGKDEQCLGRQKDPAIHGRSDGDSQE